MNITEGIIAYRSQLNKLIYDIKEGQANYVEDLEV